MALFVLSLCPFDISVGVGDFVIGLSQISSFFSKTKCQDIVVSGVRKHFLFKFKFILFHQISNGGVRSPECNADVRGTRGRGHGHLLQDMWHTDLRGLLQDGSQRSWLDHHGKDRKAAEERARGDRPGHQGERSASSEGREIRRYTTGRGQS